MYIDGLQFAAEERCLKDITSRKLLAIILLTPLWLPCYLQINGVITSGIFGDVLSPILYMNTVIV